MQNTAESTRHPARALLNVMTDDQLARYGEIARDQASVELRRWWLQALLALCSVLVFGWAIVKWGIAGVEAVGIEAAGFGRSVAAGLGIGLLMAYFPYRRVKNWTLWNHHCKAVAEEQTRRRSGKTVYASRTLQGGG